MIRPFKLNEAMIAMAGAALLLIVGLINPLDALTTLTSDWNTFFFFLGMMSLSALERALSHINGHYYEQNGDQLPDPEIRMTNDGVPILMRQSGIGVHETHAMWKESERT